MRRTRSHSLRGRVRRAIGWTVATALLLLGLPLAVALDRQIGASALTGLQRDATRALAAVPDNVVQSGAQLRVPEAGGRVLLGVYDTAGRRVAGQGPAVSSLAQQLPDGREHHGTEARQLAVVLPVLSDSSVVGGVRAALPRSVLDGRVHRAWLLLLTLTAGVVVVAAAVGARAARRVSRPFELMTQALGQLSSGRYDLQLPAFGLTEADAAAVALRRSGEVVDELLRHEREFVHHASHQLRTPLASLMLSLEKERPDVPAAMAAAQQLQGTISDLVALRTRVGDGRSDPRSLVSDAVQRRQSLGTSVVMRADDVPDVAIASEGLRQALDVLLDNALRHGAGLVTVTVEAYGDHVVVEVGDEGPGFGDEVVEGTGLRLARTIVERAGGEVIVRRTGRRPRVALMLPIAHEPAQSTS
jgi:signal transduction histidine kinase